MYVSLLLLTPYFKTFNSTKPKLNVPTVYSKINKSFMTLLTQYVLAIKYSCLVYLLTTE